MRVADVGDPVANEPRHVDVRLGRDLTGDHDEPVVTSVSQATRPFASSASTASSTESEIWSAILSG